MANLERIYTIPLGDAYLRVRNKRAKRAIAFVRAFATRHMKAAEVKISEGTNSLVFRDGMQKPPRKLKVRIVRGDDAIARVWLIGEEEKLKTAAEAKKKDEASKADAEKKAAEQKKADAAKAEAEKKAAEQKKAEAAKVASSTAKSAPAQAAAKSIPSQQPAQQKAPVQQAQSSQAAPKQAPAPAPVLQKK
jgi:large subunit ribosomal protein L31e